MKKILLTFLGLVFFAHMSYASWYVFKMIDNYGDIGTGLLNITDCPFSNGISCAVNKVVPNSVYQNYCEDSGLGNPNQQPGRLIICDISGNVTNDVSGSWVFWARKATSNLSAVDNCENYLNDIVDAGNTDMRCETTTSGGWSQVGFKVQRIYEPTYSWHWSKSKGIFYHDLSIKLKDQKGTTQQTVKISKTALSASAAVTELNKLKCIKANDGELSNAVSCSKVDTNTVNCNLNNCPTPARDKGGNIYRAAVQYWTADECSAHCSRSPMNGNVCENCYSASYNVSWYLNPGRSNYSGTPDPSVKLGKIKLKCKSYYDQWTGNKTSGGCLGTYTVHKKDGAGTYQSSNKTTTDITKAVDQALSGLSTGDYMRSCIGDTNGKHNGTPGSHNVYCTCDTNEFWTESRCKGNVGATKYCEKNSRAGDVCAYNLKTCASGTYTVSNCNNACSTSQYCKNTKSGACNYQVTSCASNTYSGSQKCEDTRSGSQYCKDNGSTWDPGSYQNRCRYEITNCPSNQYTKDTKGNNACSKKISDSGTASSQYCDNNGSGSCLVKLNTCASNTYTNSGYNTCVDAANHMNGGNYYCKSGNGQCPYSIATCNSGTYSVSGSCSVPADGLKYCKDTNTYNNNGACRYQLTSCAKKNNLQTYERQDKCEAARNGAQYCAGNSKDTTNNYCTYALTACPSNTYRTEQACKDAKGNNTGKYCKNAGSGNCPWSLNNCTSGTYSNGTSTTASQACETARNGNGSKVCYASNESDKAYCPTKLWTCDSNRYSTSAACQSARGTKNASNDNYVKYYCNNDTSNKCAWHFTAASNTVSSCNGSTTYIDKYDSNRACKKK